MVIASIDLMKGKAVQLRRGQEMMLERNNPLSLAKQFDRYGEIAVIDLDAAMNKGNNSSTIKEILRIAECRVGGGIREIEQARELISLGAKKIIIGSKAFENDMINHDFLRKLLAQIGRHRVIIAIDSLNGEIVTKAWKHRTGLRPLDTARKLEKYASEFLFTCVDREGTMTGTNMAQTQELANRTKNRITVAGGISSLNEISKLAQLGIDVQLGMALYTGKIKLDQAFIKSLNWGSKFIPTITQDSKQQVLMLAYSNRASLKRTFETRKMWYFSRSRRRLWMKGETSGNTQKLIKMRTDCDRDTILATVEQKGVACHLDNYSCFGDQKFSLNDLNEIIKDRIENPKSTSFTAKLTNRLLKEKLKEEVNELIEAQLRDDIIWEAADLLYFITVLLVKNDISVNDILDELRRRKR